MPAGNLYKIHQRSFHSWTKFYQRIDQFQQNHQNSIFEFTNVRTILDEKLKENTNILANFYDFGFNAKKRCIPSSNTLKKVSKSKSTKSS